MYRTLLPVDRYKVKAKRGKKATKTMDIMVPCAVLRVLVLSDELEVWLEADELPGFELATG